MTTTVKMIRERLCYGERSGNIETLYTAVIALCDVLRPLGPDGKHSDRHTPLCGCDDVEPTPSAATSSGLGDALRALADRRPACHVDTDGVAWQEVDEDTLRQFADQADTLTADRDSWQATSQAQHTELMSLRHEVEVLTRERDRLAGCLTDERLAHADERNDLRDRAELAEVRAARLVKQLQRSHRQLQRSQEKGRHQRDELRRVVAERDEARAAVEQATASVESIDAATQRRIDRLSAERAYAWAIVGRVRATLSRWTGTPGAYTHHGSVLARAWEAAVIDIETALDDPDGARGQGRTS